MRTWCGNTDDSEHIDRSGFFGIVEKRLITVGSKESERKQAHTTLTETCALIRSREIAGDWKGI